VSSADLFVSLFPYTYAKLSGFAWTEVQQRELAHCAESRWPDFRTLGQVGRLVPELAQEVHAYVDGSTLITKARSRAAGFFLRSPADVWLTVDDDIEADAATLRKLVLTARATRGVVGVPYVLRDGRALSFEFATLDPTRVHASGEVWTYLAEGGIGFGLVAMHRRAIERMAEGAAWVGTREEGFPALFLEAIGTNQGTRRHEWVGEDYYFSRGCHARDVPMCLLCDVAVSHAGHVCRLTRELELQVRDPETQRTLESAPATPRNA
jgi:hypothetical protein